jgi:hypothetical protein
MIHLVIDTCVWIELCNDLLSEVRQKLTWLIEQKKVLLLLPSIVIEEWNRQKSKVLAERSQSVRGKIKNAKTISEYLSPDLADHLEEMLTTIDDEFIEKTASAPIREIEHLFAVPTTVVLNASDRAKVTAAEYALAKKAPFRMKNSMADALILLSATEYIISNGIKDSIFVSGNTQDFSSTSDKAKINEDLKDLFEAPRMKYFTNIGLAINEVESDLVSSETIKVIETTSALEAIQDAFRSIQVYDRQLLESMEQIGKLSPMSDAIKAAEEANRRLQEIMAPLKMSNLEETLRSVDKYDQHMDSIKMVRDLPAITESVRAAEEANRRLQEIMAPLSNL